MERIVYFSAVHGPPLAPDTHKFKPPTQTQFLEYPTIISSNLPQVSGVAQSVYRLVTAGRSGDPIPVGATFSAPIQTGPGAHSVSYKMRTVSFPGSARPRRGAEHPPHLAQRLNKK